MPINSKIQKNPKKSKKYKRDIMQLFSADAAIFKNEKKNNFKYIVCIPF